MKKPICQRQITITSRLSVVMEKERKSSHDKQRYKEFLATKTILQRTLEEILGSEEEINIAKKTQETRNSPEYQIKRCQIELNKNNKMIGIEKHYSMKSQY